MTEKEMEYILAIANERSLSRAAEKLFLTQPALSLFLSRTEEALKVRLFTRTSRGMVPTYAGERYLEYAKRALALGRDFDLELCEIQRERKGVLRVGTSAHIGSVALPKILPSFHAEYPGINVSIVEGTSGVLEKLSEEADIDLALMHLPLTNSTLSYTEIAYDRYVMVFSRNHSLYKQIYEKPGFSRHFIDPRLAKDESFILAFPQQRVRQISDRILRSAGIEPSIRLLTGSVQTAMRFAACGMGITFMPESYIPLFAAEPEAAYCYLEEEFNAYWTFCIVHPPAASLSSPVRTFIRITQETFTASNVK